MRRGVAAVTLLLLACADADDTTSSAAPSPKAEPTNPESKREPKSELSQKPPPSSKAWTFAVLSDLHVPNFHDRRVHQAVAALVAMKVRFVVVTGDHTNGSLIDGPARMAKYPTWWATLTTALKPLRDAGIAVFPVAGNHDSYLKPQREGYAGAFGDLAEWAKPYAIRAPRGDTQISRAPFTYSVDVDGVHLSLIHTIKSKLDDGVATWLEKDLEAAKDARHRFVFTHVPLVSVIWLPKRPFGARLGRILERGKVGLYASGHEHLVWDEDVVLPEGGTLRQLIVGCVSGYYNYPPSEPSKRRAKCVPITVDKLVEPMKCKMPNGGEFRIARGRRNRHLQHRENAFMLVTVDGAEVRTRPMTVDANGKALPFYLDE